MPGCLRGTMETTKLKKMMKVVENALTAVSFAEEGEFETARSIAFENRRILLGLNQGQVDAKTLKYALNTAKRVNAELHILYVAAAAGRENIVDPLLEQFETELKAQGIPCRIVRRAGCLKQQIIDYTNNEKEILFAVIESPASLDAGCNRKDKSLTELWQKLKCPLVVVMDGAGA